MSEKTVGGKYGVGKRLGKGSFGEVRLGTDLRTAVKVAIKLESLKSEYTLLPSEARLYKLFQGGLGFPNIHYFGTEAKHCALVIDLLGPSLANLFNSCGRKFTVQTVAMIGEQALARLEYMHNRNFIHRDLKPDNFLIGQGKSAGIIHLIDFGLAKKYRAGGKHIAYREGKSLTGTSRYASLNAHRGIQQSRRDDLEALGYVLVYFAQGCLPWQGLDVPEGMDRDDLIRDFKAATSAEELCEGLPRAFVEYTRYCRALAFDEKPNYLYLKRLMKSMQSQGKFDWVKSKGLKSKKTDQDESIDTRDNSFQC